MLKKLAKRIKINTSPTLDHKRGPWGYLFPQRSKWISKADLESARQKTSGIRWLARGQGRESVTTGLRRDDGMHRATPSINLLPLHLHTSYSPILIFLLTYRVRLLNHRRLSSRRRLRVGSDYSRRSGVKGISVFVSRRANEIMMSGVGRPGVTEL